MERKKKFKSRIIIELEEVETSPDDDWYDEDEIKENVRRACRKILVSNNFIHSSEYTLKVEVESLEVEDLGIVESTIEDELYD